MGHPTSIVITGASSGIGAALARRYAASGVALGLMGRNAERLAHVASECVALGASVTTGTVDVRETFAMGDWITRFDATHPIDLLIANAGISAGSGGQYESAEQVRSIFAVNVDGVLASVLPVLPLMQARKRGQIAIMSSLAGIRALPGCPAYSASKASVRYFGDALRGLMKKDGIHVSVICPGYIRTPMTEVNSFPMPLLMDASKAARIIAAGLARKRGRIAFPLALYLPLWLLSCLPLALTDAFFAALPGKSAMQKP